ncbi:hypothetical protein DL96DRAFT_498556 [Flagelloscypha sp. PMI_526]|nr:hypothetical protein DL96DRAFT_498556 [Flagelloscypha sp. PMI_526]
MNSLPADILPCIVCSLDTSDLGSCSLVTRTFHHIAQRLLFSHLALSHSTWQARCSFFLKGRGIRLLKYITSLTLKVSSVPFFDNTENIPSLLTSLLQRISQHGLQSLCIHASPPFEWSHWHHRFQDMIFSSVFPWISSLQFHWVNHVPVLTVVQKCPNLARLEPSPASAGTVEEITGNDARSLSRLTSLTMNLFSHFDLEKGSSLHQYITLAGTKIQSLELLSFMSLYDYPTSLEPFASFSQQLRHLSFALTSAM